MISELLIFINVQVVFRTFKLAVVAKVRGLFFLIGKISIRIIRFSLPPFS